MAKKNIATFLGPNKGLSVVGAYAYAYSGNIASGSSDAEGTALDFTTGNYILKGQLQFCHPTDATEDMTYRIYFNGQVIQRWMNTGNLEPNQPQNPVFIIIPPRTVVKVTVASAGSARGQLASITGRIYNV